MATTTPALAVVTVFHKQLAAAIDKGTKAAHTMRETVLALIKGRYDETLPVYAEYCEDQSALEQLAKDRKLSDNQYYRKLYAAAINELYGALPVSMDEAASKKRAQRLTQAPAHQRLAYEQAKKELKGKPVHVVESLAVAAMKAAKAPAKQDNPGAPQGEVKDQEPSAPESLEQLITRLGMPIVLEACAKILASEKATTTAAKTLTAISAQLRLAKCGKAA